VLESCAAQLRQSPGQEWSAFQIGTIDRPRGAGAGIAVRRTETEHDDGGREWLWLAGAWHVCDRPHGATAIRTDCEVSSGERAIAFAAIVGRLAGTSVTAIEQPLTESDAVGAGAIAEEAIVADTMEAVWQSV
jgi:hypothetical protein